MLFNIRSRSPILSQHRVNASFFLLETNSRDFAYAINPCSVELCVSMFHSLKAGIAETNFHFFLIFVNFDTKYLQIHYFVHTNHDNNDFIR